MKRVLRGLMLISLLVPLIHTAAAQQATRPAPATPQAAGDLRQGAAPKAMEDPRPLQGLDRSHLAPYAPQRARLLAPSSGSPGAFVRARTTPAGRRLQRVPAGQGLRSTGGGGTPLGLKVQGTVHVERAPNGTIRWMRGDLGRPAALGAAGKQAALSRYATAAVSVAEALAEPLRLQDPDAELRPLATTRDRLGYVHARFEQVYDDVPVWGRDLYVHFDATGAVYAVNGTYEPTPVGVATTPDLSADAARAVVEADLRAEGRWAPPAPEAAAWLGLDRVENRLVLYPAEGRSMRLAYEVSLHPNLLEWYTMLVDARTGEILNRVARHCTLRHEASPVDPPRVTAVPDGGTRAGAAGTFFSAPATDLNGQQQTLRVYQHDDGIFYSLWDLPNLNQGASQLPDNPAGGALTISANETDLNEQVQLTHVTSANNTWTDPSGVSAHVNMKVAYDYYRDTHGRDAIDGNDQSIISIVHVTDGGQSMDNAFWNGRVMAYGDGQSFFRPLAGALDVAGHEMTHGVIQHTADLIYQFQSGALNESFADVFGAMVDREDLLKGEDVALQGIALRDLLNPDNPQVLSQQPAHMNQYRNLNANQDNGGVHVNSGIPNRAAALIMQAIGRSKTEDIYYRALSSYLTRNSQFGDARNAVEQATRDLFGAGSELAAVQQAFDAVGILGASGNDGSEGNDLPAQTGGQSLIAFIQEDGSISLLDVTDVDVLNANDLGNAQLFTFNNPDVAVRVSDGGDRAQLSTPLNGERIWFINQNLQLAALDLAQDQLFVFDDVFIQQPGDLWNASIGPNEAYVTLVSAYENDATLYFYFFDDEDPLALPLEAETTQDGIENETILYPDVVAWSPNPTLPKIAFDAFNEVPFFLGGSINYWSMYEIDFESERIYNLIPAQPTDLSVGNVTYGNTDPDVIGFNILDEDGTWDVVVGNFEQGVVNALGLSNFTINGTAVSDAQRPSFAPDDTRLVVSTPSFGALLFTDVAASSATFLNMQNAVGTPVYNPRWYVRGGSGGAQNQAPSASFTATPSTGTAPLLVSVDASGSSDPEGDGLTYRWDFGDGSTSGGRSTSHAYTGEGTFTVTLTVTDSGGLSGTATRQVTVEATPSGEATALRNFDPEGNQLIWTVESVAPVDSGFVFGTNFYGDQAKATAFALPAGTSSAQVTEVKVWFGFKGAGVTNQSYRVEVLNGTPSSGPTGSPLFSASYQLINVNADADLQTAEEPTVHALPSVAVGSTFFVSVDFGSYGQADWASAAIVATDQLGQRVAEAWEKWNDGTWHNVSDAWFEGADGWHVWIEATVETGTGVAVEDAAEVPTSVALSPNYPNPFNPSTLLRVDLPAATDVELEVVDLLGRRVATLLDGLLPAGRHDVRFDASGLPSGLYLARLRAGDVVRTQTMTLMR